MLINIEKYNPIYHKDIIELIITILQKEFGIQATYEDQFDLEDICGFYDKFWTATSSGKVIGTIGLKIISDFAIIRKVFVAKEYRGIDFGVAQKLLATLETEVISRGISKIYLGTAESFKAAHRFYEKNDYIEIAASDLPADFPMMKFVTKFYCKLI